jgi:hypothetical protein
MPNQLRDVHVGLVSFVDRAAQRSAQNPNQPQRFLLYKAEGALTKGPDMPDTINKDELDPAVRELVDKAEKDAADAQAAVEKANKERDEAIAKAKEEPVKKDEKDEPKPINKDELSPEVRAIVEKAEKDAAANAEALEKAEKEAKAAHDIAKAERDTRVTGEWIAKAESGDLRGLPGKPAEVGPVLKSLAEAAPEAWAEFEKSVLTPAAAQLRESDLLKEQGAGGEGPPPDSALAKFEAKVDELRKADTSLSKSAAKERVRKENPELMRQIHNELGAGKAPANA